MKTTKKDHYISLIHQSKLNCFFIYKLRLFLDYGLELSRIVPLIIFHLKRKYLCKTDDELKEAWFPGEIGYSTRVPSDMLVITIVLCYSVIAPLVIPFGVLYFCLGWLILRNQVNPSTFDLHFLMLHLVNGFLIFLYDLKLLDK